MMGRDDAKPEDASGAIRTALEKFFRLSVSSGELITPRMSQQDLGAIARELEAKRAARDEDSSSDEQPAERQLADIPSCGFRDPQRSRRMSWGLNPPEASQSTDSDLSSSPTPDAFGQESGAQEVLDKSGKAPEVICSKDILQGRDSDVDNLQTLVCEEVVNEYTVPVKHSNMGEFGLAFERFEPLRERRLVEIDDRELRNFLGRGQLASARSGGELTGLLAFVAQMLAANARVPAPPPPLVIANIQTVAQVRTAETTPFTLSGGKCPEALVADLLAAVDRKTERTRAYMYTTPCQNPDCKYEIPILPPRVFDRSDQPGCSRKFISLCRLRCACRDGCLLHIINFLEETYGCELNQRDSTVRRSASSKVSFDQPALTRSQERWSPSPYKLGICSRFAQKLPAVDACTSMSSVTSKTISPGGSPKQKWSKERLSSVSSCDKCCEGKSKICQPAQKPALSRPIRKTDIEPTTRNTPPQSRKSSKTNCVECRPSLQKMPSQQSLTMCSLKPTLSQIKCPQINKSPSQTSCLALQQTQCEPTRPKCGQTQMKPNQPCPAKAQVSACEPCPGPQQLSRTLLKPPQIALDLQTEMLMHPTGIPTCPGSKTCLQKIECVEKVTDCTLVPGGECILEKLCVPLKSCTPKEKAFMCDKLPCPSTMPIPDDLCRSRGTSTSLEVLKQQQRGSPFICGMFGKMRVKLFGNCPPVSSGKKQRCRDKNPCSEDVGSSGRKSKWKALPLQPTKLLCSESSSCSQLDFSTARSFREKATAPCHRSCKGVQVSKATCNASAATSALKSVSCADSGTHVMITSYDEAPPSHASQLCVRRLAPSKGPCGYPLPQVKGASCKEVHGSTANDECLCTSDEGLSDSNPFEMDPAASSKATFCLGSARESPPPRKKCDPPNFTCEVDSKRFEPPPCVYITPSNEVVMGRCALKRSQVDNSKC